MSSVANMTTSNCYISQPKTAPKDCAQIVKMAELLHIPTASPGEFELLKANCCEFRYFTCTGNHVVGVCLAELSLYGTLDVSLLPATVTLFEIFGNHVNKVIGQFQTTNLQQMYMDYNEISGPLFEIPSTLTTLFIGKNFLNGTIDLSNARNLKLLGIGDNYFEGALNISGLSLSLLQY
eukprot:NODE_903_length_3183_cov_0.453632.p3 type:complete len:179 gc:universal NODE_903_length_3183_cov_0.453632:2348-2884(+)